MDYLIDVWEGNPDLDYDILKENGVFGGFVRLNDMNGGHHMDVAFRMLYDEFDTFDCKGVYFVYNPWVGGRANYEWLIANMPANFGNRRLAIDLEVRYPGYSAKEYGRQVATFVYLVKLVYQNVVFYTGAGYMDLMTEWPTGDYWWARYLYAFQMGYTTWEAFNAVVEKTDWLADPSNLCPGEVRIWQICDHTILPGFGGHAVDLNLSNMSKSDTIAWMNGGEVVPESGTTENNEENNDTQQETTMIVNSSTGLNIRDDDNKIIGGLLPNAEITVLGDSGTFTQGGKVYPMVDIKVRVAKPLLRSK